jgi:uncharacterized protein YgiM (DUF1202 family)
MKQLIVKKEHKSSFQYPVKLVKGENVTVERKETIYNGWIWATTKNGNSGWVPEKILKIDNNEGMALQTYNATELNVNVGEKLRFLREINDWYWVENGKGALGWIPKNSVDSFKNENEK